VLNELLFEGESNLTEIEPWAFGQANISSVIFPASLTTTGVYYFRSATFGSVSFAPDSVLKRIEEKVFGFTRIKSIFIPKVVEFIDPSAFLGSFIDKVTIDPFNQRYAVDRDFILDTTELKLVRHFGPGRDIVVRKDIKSIGASCFEGGEEDDQKIIENITFEEGSALTVIDDRCFAHCTFASLVFPASLERLGMFCFEWAIGESVSFEPGSKVKAIEDYCFRFAKIKAITIPKSCESFAVWVFEEAAIESLEFEPDSNLALIGDYCFSRASLKKIRIPKYVEAVGNSCFSQTNLTELVFEPDSRLKRIGALCFVRSALKRIHITRNVEYIGGRAFVESAIDSVTVDPANKVFALENDCLINKLNSSLIRYFGKGGDIVIPKEIKVICEACFSGEEDRMTVIEAVEFEAGTEVATFEESSFRFCHIDSLMIPKTVTKIAPHSFEYLEIRWLVFEPDSQLQQLEERVFAFCSIKELVIPRSVEVLGPYCFVNAKALSLTFEEGSRLKRIEEKCFVGCTVPKITLPASIEFVAEGAFAPETEVIRPAPPPSAATDENL
jgi:hypothetical protein